MKTDQLPLPPGLRKAVLNVPSLIIPIWAVYAGLEPVSEGLDGQLPKLTIESFQILFATLIGTILYSIGDFWDEVFFDKRYSVVFPQASDENYSKMEEGKWLQRVHKPFKVYPAGQPLTKARDKFIQTDPGLVEKNGYGCYRVAMNRLKDQNKWSAVEDSILISKLVRSFIFPFALVGIFSGCFYIWVLFTTREVIHPSGLGFILGVGLALLATIPYCRFRVEHMISLYDKAAGIQAEE